MKAKEPLAGSPAGKQLRMRVTIGVLTAEDRYKDCRKGDVVEVSEATAEFLLKRNWAEAVNVAETKD